MSAGRDDQVLFEVAAEVEAAKATLAQFVADAKAQLETLGQGAAINISVEAVQVALEQLSVTIGSVRTLVAEPEVLVIETGAAVAEAETVLAAVEKVKREVATVGAGAPAAVGQLAEAFSLAAAKVDDFAARTEADSEKLGVGIQRAALSAKVALRSLEETILEVRESGGAVSPADIERLELLRAAYFSAAEEAQQLALTQAEVRAETAALLADSDRLAAAFAALVESELEVVAGVDQARAAIARMGSTPAELSAVDIAFQKAGVAVDEFAGRTTVGSEQFGRSIERGALEAKVALQELTNQVLTAKSAGSPITPEQIAALALLEEKYRLAVIQARELARLQGLLRQELRQTGDEARGTAGKTDDLAASVERFAAVVKAYLAVMIVSEIRELGKAAVDAAKDMVSIHVALETAVGDSKRAGEEFEFVREVMNHFGLDLKAGLEGFTKLAGAARDTALAGKPVRDAFYSIAEAASAMHLSTQTQEQVFYALSEIMSKGTLQAQQLQRQLAIAIPGATQIAARALGLTIEELEHALKQGAITAEDFIPRFAYQLDHELREKAEHAADSSVAAIGRFNNALYEAKATLGEQLLPELAKVGASLADVLHNGAPIIEFVGKAVAAWLGFASTMLHVWDGIKETVAGIAATLQEFGAQIVATVAKAIGALAGLADAVGLHEFAAKVRATAAEVGRYFGDMAEGFSDVAHQHAKRAADDFAKVGDGASAARPAVAGMGAEVGSLGDKFDVATKRLAAMIKATVEYGNELRSQGSVTREEADKLVKEVEKELKAIRELPAAERKAFADREAMLVGFYNQYFKFTTEYEKLHEKQQKAAQKTAEEEAKQFAARERNLLKFLQDLDNIAKKDAGSGKDRDAIQKQLEAAKQELTGLQGKPLVGADDLNRMGELRKQISGLQGDLTKLGPASTAASGGVQRMAQVSDAALGEIRNHLLDTISNSKDFAATWAKLTPQVQGDLKGLVSNFVQLLDSGKATVGQVSEFAEAFARMTAGAGAAGDQVVAKFRAMTDSSQQVRTAFDGLTAGADKTAGSLNTTAAASGPAAEGMKQVAAAAGQAENAAAGTGGGYIKLHDATKHLTNAQGELLPNFVAVVNAADRVGTGSIKAGGEIWDMGEKAKGASPSLEAAAASTQKVGEQAAKTGEEVEKTSAGYIRAHDAAAKLDGEHGHLVKSYVEVGGAAKEAGRSVEAYGVGAKKAGDEAHQGAAGIAESGKATADAVAPTAALVAQLAKLPDLKLPAYWHDIAQALIESVKGFQDANREVGVLVSTITTDLPKLKEFVAVLKDVRAEARGLTTDIAAQNVVMRDAVQLCNALTACQKEAAKA